MKGRIWTVPNQITFLRLGFLPVFLMLIAYDHYRWALLVLVVSGISDGFDGLLARSLNQRSALGAYLDPIADKLLLSSSFVLLAFKKQLAWWLTILVLSRDVLILIVAVVILLTSGYRPFPPSIYGKLTTATEIILVFLIVLGAAYPHYHVAGLNQILIMPFRGLATPPAFPFPFPLPRPLQGLPLEERGRPKPPVGGHFFAGS